MDIPEERLTIARSRLRRRDPGARWRDGEAERASLLDRPQRLGILPTLWYWRRVDGSPAASTIALGSGLAAGLAGGALFPSGIAGVPCAAALAVVLIGLCERAIRRMVRARRR